MSECVYSEKKRKIFTKQEEEEEKRFNHENGLRRCSADRFDFIEVTINK